MSQHRNTQPKTSTPSIMGTPVPLTRPLPPVFPLLPPFARRDENGCARTFDPSVLWTTDEDTYPHWES